jgi:hypothetical protein
MSSSLGDLAILDQASRLLAQAKSLDEVKVIRDKAEAARNYVKAAKLGLELQNLAAEVKLRAERRAGGLLRSLKLRGGDRKSSVRDRVLKLVDLGISRKQSNRWQTVASVPDDDFERYLKDACVLGKEVTSAGVLRIAKNRKTNSVQDNVRCGTEQEQESELTAADIGPGTSVRDGLLLELTNHCQLLASILSPVYERGEFQLKSGERRAIGYLLKEMFNVINQLRGGTKRPHDGAFGL